MGVQESQTRGQLRPRRVERPDRGEPVAPSWRRRTFERLLATPHWLVALPIVVIFLGACVVSVADDGVNPVLTYPGRALEPDSMLALFLLVVIVSLWGASSYFRCTDTLIRRCLHGITVLCLFWLVVTLVKYQVQEPSIWKTVLWYLYYLPMTLVPSFLVVCAARVARVDRRPAIRQVERAMFVGSLALSAVVLTNDLHHLAFVPIDGLWPNDYSYGPAYFCIWVWTGAEALAFFALLLSVARTQLRSVLLFLAGLAGFGGAYSLLYVMRMDLILTRSVTVVFVTIFIATCELCLRSGLFPSCYDYLRVFEKLPLDLRLFSANDGQTRATSSATREIPALFPRAEAALAEGGDHASFHPEATPDLMSRAYRVYGGIAVLTEDISLVNERRRSLDERQRVLRRQNELLVSYRQAQTELHRRRVEAELYRSVEESLQEATSTISVLLAELCARDSNGDGVDPGDRRHLMVLLKLLVSYCKRKGGLVLRQQVPGAFERDRLALMINETMADLRTAGVDCAALVETEEALSVPASSLTCDCLYAFALMAASCEDPTLMLFLRCADGRMVELNVMLESPTVGGMGGSKARRALERSLARSEADHSFREGDDALALNVLMPREG